MFRIITGTILILVGLVLLYFAVVESWIMLIHAGVAGGIGIAILLNKTEDEIEGINSVKAEEEKHE